VLTSATCDVGGLTSLFCCRARATCHSVCVSRGSGTYYCSSAEALLWCTSHGRAAWHQHAGQIVLQHDTSSNPVIPASTGTPADTASQQTLLLFECRDNTGQQAARAVLGMHEFSMLLACCCNPSPGTGLESAGRMLQMTPAHCDPQSTS
jgi:hypothetical protein